MVAEKKKKVTKKETASYSKVQYLQEALAAGIESALQPGDAIVTAYRQHGIAIGRGVGMKEAMAELYGKSTGIVKGKGGSMHFFYKENKYFGGNGIVGAQIPIGTGIAFAEKYRDTDNLCVLRWRVPVMCMICTKLVMLLICQASRWTACARKRYTKRLKERLNIFARVRVLIF